MTENDPWKTIFSVLLIDSFKISLHLTPIGKLS